MKTVKFMQIMTHNGTHFQFGVSSFKEYKTKKQMILKSKEKFVDVIDTCTINTSQISSIEYFEKEIGNES